MALDQMTQDTLDQRLNELYWKSSMTIDEIVDDLGVGRNTLYSAVMPFNTDVACPNCGETLVFTNRTNRASGTAVCASCGVESAISGSAASPQRTAARQEVGVDEDSGMWNRWRGEFAAVQPERAALIGGAAALGVLLGAAAAKAFRH